MGKDYYAILGITKSATADDIRRAYRKQAVKYHPDKNPSSDASNVFQEIGEAYEILSNEELRRIYDQYGEEGVKNQGRGQGHGRPHSGGFQFRTPDDIFRNFFGGQDPFADFFGGSTRRAAPSRGFFGRPDMAAPSPSPFAFPPSLFDDPFGSDDMDISTSSTSSSFESGRDLFNRKRHNPFGGLFGFGEPFGRRRMQGGGGVKAGSRSTSVSTHTVWTGGKKISRIETTTMDEYGNREVRVEEVEEDVNTGQRPQRKGGIHIEG